MNPKIYGFFHVSSVGIYEEVIMEQLICMEKSGLLNEISNLCVGYVGTQPELIKPLIDQFSHYPMALEALHPDPLAFEWPTALRLWNFCQSAEELAYIFYIHSKGVWNRKIGSDDWRRYMMYFNIERWKDCVEALKDYDMCGVNWKPKVIGIIPSSHFQGNFWWARSDYIKKLPSPQKFDHTGKPFKGSYRCDIEFWHGSLEPKIKSFHHAEINLYHNEYPRENYVIELAEDIHRN